MLRYRVANTTATRRGASEQPGVTPYWLTDRKLPPGAGWLTEELTDAAGRAVPHIAQFDPQQFAGGVQVDIRQFFVPALGTHRGYEVINHHFAVPAPGRYTLTVHVNLVSSNDAEVPGPLDGDTLTQTFSLPLTITPADPARLASDAQALTTAILKNPNGKGGDFETWSMQLRSLFSLPATAAAPYWRHLAQQHVDIADELYRVHTAAAADVLATVAADPSNPQMARDFLTRMQWMYDTGDDALKQHITALYAEYGIDSRFENVVTN